MSDEDPRLTELKSVTVYGLFHGPLLIYVGATRKPLDRRLDFHRNQARRGVSAPIHTYLRILSKTADLREVLSIKELDAATEQEAIDRYPSTLNVADATPVAPYTGHEWTSEELDQLGTLPDQAVSDQLGLRLDEVRDARAKLGISPSRGDMEMTMVDWDQWDDQLGTMPDTALAEKIGCSSGNVLRRRRQVGTEAYGGDRSPRLSPRRVREIRRRYQDEDTTYAELGDEYDRAPSLIGRIIRRDTYANV